MKRYRFAILVLVFTLILDQFGGAVFSKLYFSEKGYQNDRLIHSAVGTNEDILIFGSSRALHHFNPQVFCDSLGLTCYNVGSGGQNIFYHYALLSSALERYTPKMAILELFMIDFIKTSSIWDTDQLNVLLPFASKSKGIYDIILLRGDSERIKLLSGIYPYNSLAYTTFRNIVKPFNNHIYGYIPIDRTWKQPREVQKLEQQEIDTLKLQHLFKFIEKCKSNGVDLHITISPQFVDLQGEDPYHEIAEKLRTQFDLTINSFLQDTSFINSPMFFSDPLHLNSVGADKYSRRVVQCLKRTNQE